MKKIVMNLTNKKDNLKAALLTITALASICGGMLLTARKPAQAQNTEDSTYTVCYFKKGGTTTWHWGLDGRNNWYQILGSWETSINRTQKYIFKTDTRFKQIYQSCLNSRRYYKKSDYTIIGIYVSNSNIGKNYEVYTPEGRVLDRFR